MIDDTMGEDIRATERTRIRTKVAALKQSDEGCALMQPCDHCAYNDAIDDALYLIENPAPETTP